MHDPAPPRVKRRLRLLLYTGLSPQQVFSNVTLCPMTVVTDPNIGEGSLMNEPRDSISPIDGAHYREMAHGLRKLAHQCRFAGARRELLQLAASYERTGDHFDHRAITSSRHPLAARNASAVYSPLTAAA